MKPHLLTHRFKSISIIITAALTLYAFPFCTKRGQGNSKMASYYVMYVINGNGSYGRFSNWTASTPQGTYTNNGYQTRSWSATYGPIKRGFKCEVQIGSYIDEPPTIEIHVSKNNEPFAIKAISTGKTASYTVTF